MFYNTTAVIYYSVSDHSQKFIVLFASPYITISPTLLQS